MVKDKDNNITFAWKKVFAHKLSLGDSWALKISNLMNDETYDDLQIDVNLQTEGLTSAWVK